MDEFTERVEKVLKICINKGDDNLLYIWDEEVRNLFRWDDIEIIIETIKKILDMVNKDPRLYDYEVSDLIKMAN